MFRIPVEIIQAYESERQSWAFCLEPELKLKIRRSRIRSSVENL